MAAGPEFFLVLTFITAGAQTPDFERRVPMATLDECFSQAKEFTKHGVPKLAHEHGVVAVMGACMSAEVESDDGT
jgi:hypothetical protein